MTAEELAFGLWCESSPVRSVREGLYMTAEERYAEWLLRPMGERMTWVLRARTIVRFVAEREGMRAAIAEELADAQLV
jgi:hypothetical protein